jgi:integrase
MSATKRRTNVEPGIYRRPDGRLEIGWRDSTGRQRWQVVSGGIKAARADLATQVAKRATGEVIAASPRLTFNAAADAWWNGRAVRLRPATQRLYGFQLAHLRKQFGNQRLTAISPSAVAVYLAQQERQGVAGWTLHSRLSVLSAVIRYAMRHLGHAGTNPVAALDRVERPSMAVKTAKVILNDDELAKLIEATDAPHRLLVQLFAETGCRKGEAAGLTWESIDLDAMTLTIDAQLDRYTGKRAPTKTARSVRTIVITPTLAAALKVRHLAAGRPATGLVFRRPGGKPCGHGQIDWMVTVARKRAGLSEITSHSLRHTHASRLIAAGWDVAEIAARLGDSIPTVMSTYAHEFDAARRRDEQRDRLTALYGSTVEAAASNATQQTPPPAGSNVTPLHAEAV